MIKSFAAKLLIGATFASLTAAMLLAPQQASAGGTTSLGHGVKCGWVVVSSDPATGTNVYKWVCRKGGA